MQARVKSEQSGHEIEAVIAERPRLASVMFAMWARAEGRRLATELRSSGIPVMVLKGPELQERLYGTPAAYASSDIDILVRPRDAERSRRAMRRNGWRFEPENGVLWKLSRAASFERQGFRADLHWGLHAAHLPAWAMRPLERALWERAHRAASGYLSPDAESLFVFLAVHAAGHAFERPQWVDNVHAAAQLVHDWGRVWSIADRCSVTQVVRSAMEEQHPGASIPILDGLTGRAVWWVTYVARGHMVPRSIRDQIRDALGLWRQGFGLLGVRGGSVAQIGEVTFEVERGVFEPKEVTATSVDLAARLLDENPSSEVILDVGTGSGALAILAGLRWPDAEVHGGDVSARAIRCARSNATRLRARNVRFHIGDLLKAFPEAVRGRVALVFSNVPYVSRVGGRDQHDWQVPLTTVFGPDADGLGFMRELCRQLPEVMKPDGLWVYQIGDAQLDYWADHLRMVGFEPVPPAERRPGRAIVAAARWKGES